METTEDIEFLWKWRKYLLLLASITYGAGLDPPGGMWSKDQKGRSNNSPENRILPPASLLLAPPPTVYPNRVGTQFVSEISSLQSLCAQIWISTTRTRKQLDADATTTLRLAVNCHVCAAPGLPLTGNAIERAHDGDGGGWRPTTAMAASELSELAALAIEAKEVV
ncbi:hypothetical protein ZWY2020_059913 [Hordeum vulgare]|nr:hypothetical protein ZWY2020_059913 [Hordeum vulgare]